MTLLSSLDDGVAWNVEAQNIPNTGTYMWRVPDVSAAPARLNPGGFLICEMGYAQAEAVTALIDARLWDEPRILTDLQGIPRTLVLRRIS